MTQKEIRERILGTAEDLAVSFLVYDRKEDEDLPRGAIEDAVTRWDVTIGEIALRFEQRLRELIPAPVPAYDTGQAAHVVKSKRMHAEVAEITAGG